jgi:hypothetical protein
MDLLSASLAVVTWIGVWRFYWGLEIFSPDGESLYYNPHCIAADCVGFYEEDEDGEPLEEAIPWSDEDWTEYLECEADSLIECFVDKWEEYVNE